MVEADRSASATGVRHRGAAGAMALAGTAVVDVSNFLAAPWAEVNNGVGLYYKAGRAATKNP